MAKNRDKRAVAASAAGPLTWSWAIAIASALVIAFLIYSPASQGPLVLDDRYQFFGRPEASPSGFTAWIASVRPLLNATFWINYQLSGAKTAGYHHLNVLLHAAAALVMLVLLRQLWKRAGGEPGHWAPVAAAGLFLVHPMQTESVAYISSRSEVLSVLCALGAVTLQLRAREAAISLSRIGGMLVLFAMAVLTKEHTAAMPAVFLLTDWYWRGGWQAVRSNWKLHASMAVAGMVGLAFVARVLSTAVSAGFSIKDPAPSVYLFTQFRMYWRYMRMLVLPAGLNADPDVAWSPTLADPAVLAGLAGIVALLAVAWRLRQKARLASYGIAVFTLLLAPTSSFVPILDAFAEHRVYLPFVGVCCLVLEGLRRWKMPALAVAGVLVLFAFGTFQRSAVWASESALWRDAVAGSPAKYRPRFQLAYSLYTEGDCAGAAREFEVASGLPKAKRDVTLFVDWAIALECAGKPAEALAKLDAAASIENSAHVRALIGMVHAKNQNSDRALEELKAAEMLDARFAMTYVYRGNIYALQSRRAEAEAEYERALALEPANTDAVKGLAALRGR